MTDFETMRAALKEHHDWHLAQTDHDETIMMPPADAYVDSSLYERTVDALALRPASSGAGGEPVAWRCFDKIAEAYSVITDRRHAELRMKHQVDWAVEPLYATPSPPGCPIPGETGTDACPAGAEPRGCPLSKSQRRMLRATEILGPAPGWNADIEWECSRDGATVDGPEMADLLRRGFLRADPLPADEIFAIEDDDQSLQVTHRYVVTPEGRAAIRTGAAA